MARPLTSADFPLFAIGPLVYRRTESSPIFTAPDDAMARDLARRVNRDFQHIPYGWKAVECGITDDDHDYGAPAGDIFERENLCQKP